MSAYSLNKTLREINRTPKAREAFFADAIAFVDGLDLTTDEKNALIHRDIGALYRMGVHGLILRPFTLLEKMPEADYLTAIRG